MSAMTNYAWMLVTPASLHYPLYIPCFLLLTDLLGPQLFPMSVPATGDQAEPACDRAASHGVSAGQDAYQCGCSCSGGVWAPGGCAGGAARPAGGGPAGCSGGSGHPYWGTDVPHRVRLPYVWGPTSCISMGSYGGWSICQYFQKPVHISG